MRGSGLSVKRRKPSTRTAVISIFGSNFVLALLSIRVGFHDFCRAAFQKVTAGRKRAKRATGTDNKLTNNQQTKEKRE